MILMMDIYIYIFIMYWDWMYAGWWFVFAALFVAWNYTPWISSSTITEEGV